MTTEQVKPKRKKYGGGSRKGVPNVVTKELKDMIRNALDKAGGEQYLYQQAIDNPTAFLTLIGKILPKDVNVGGQPGNPIQYEMLKDDELLYKLKQVSKVNESIVTH